MKPNLNFPNIIQVISQMHQARTKYITVRRLRNEIGVESDNGKMVRKLANTLLWLEHFGYIELDKKESPKRYVIPPDFSEKTRDIIRMYRK